MHAHGIFHILKCFLNICVFVVVLVSIKECELHAQTHIILSIYFVRTASTHSTNKLFIFSENDFLSCQTISVSISNHRQNMYNKLKGEKLLKKDNESCVYSKTLFH